MQRVNDKSKRNENFWKSFHTDGIGASAEKGTVTSADGGAGDYRPE